MKGFITLKTQVNTLLFSFTSLYCIVPQRVVHPLQHPFLNHAAEVLIGEQPVEYAFVLVPALEQKLPVHVIEPKFEVLDGV